jgi:diguanylate cyclase (GGDEF)-like protein
VKEGAFRILVVDDEPVIRQVLLNQLSLHDYRVAEAVNGPAALRYLEAENADLVLLDVMMPRMSGFDVCRQIRESAGLSELPVIFLSARNQVDDFVTGLGAGGNDYLTKPIRQAELLARVRTHIELLESHRGLELRVRERTEELSLANAELERLAHLDGLTGLANRRRFDDELARLWPELRRRGEPISLLLGDVDHFKLYNDRYGHQRGDEALRAVGSALTAAIRRPFDLAARFGGEEFALLLPGTGPAGAVEVAEAACAALRDLRIAHEPSPVAEVLTLSVGVSTCLPSHDEDTASLVRRADGALYRAKQQGRNRIVADDA